MTSLMLISYRPQTESKTKSSHCLNVVILQYKKLNKMCTFFQHLLILHTSFEDPTLHCANFLFWDILQRRQYQDYTASNGRVTDER
jgi:hypothetical protein